MSPAPEEGVLDELLDTAPCGFLSFSDDGTIRAVNATLLDMLGYSRAELVGRSLETILPVGTRIFYQTHFFPLIRLHGRAEEVFLILRGKGGEDVGVLTNAARRERGGAAANDCVFMRVRERQKFEAELLRARRAAEQARAEVEARQRELQHANDLLGAQALELELQQQQLQEQTVELEMARDELQEANDGLREQAEELQLQRRVAEDANQAKSNFLAVMSHELRTPLNAIAGYVQLLEMEIYGPVTGPQREALVRIARSQAHLLRLVNDVLNLSRLEAGRVDYTLEPVSVADLLADVAPIMEPMLAAKGLGFAADVDPALWVVADREKAQQVLINLLGNAVKFTPPGGRVAVEAAWRRDDPDRVHVRVRDTGIGIPASRLESVFEPFVQVDVSHTRRTEGTGLGLAISRDLARGMGGDLSARSAVGEGSTFTLTLPRARRDVPLPGPRGRA